jgi:hypothetical protein
MDALQHAFVKKPTQDGPSARARLSAILNADKPPVHFLHIALSHNDAS